MYCLLRLNLPRRTKKRVPARVVQPLDVSPQPNVGWAVDFMSDTSLLAERVIRVLAQATAWRGQPQAIRLDNGPEFLADRFASWCADRGIARRYIQPGQPNQNAWEVLDAYVFESLEQVRKIRAEWMREYNEDRLHDTLDGMPPTSFQVRMTAGSSPLILSP